MSEYDYMVFCDDCQLGTDYTAGCRTQREMFEKVGKHLYHNPGHTVKVKNKVTDQEIRITAEKETSELSKRTSDSEADNQ